MDLERVSRPSNDLSAIGDTSEFMDAYKHELRRRVRSENTMVAYESDWKHFTRWCRSVGLDPVPATEFTVIAYLNYWGMNPDPGISLRASTLKRRVSAIKFFNQDEGHVVLDYRNHGEDPVHDTLEMIARTQKSGTRKAKPISQQMLVHMINSQPNTLIGLRDSAILLTGFGGAMRRSEITSLELGHLDFRDLGVAVTIASSKTDQTGEGQTVYIPLARHAETCASRTLKRWIAERGDHRGPLFSSIDKYGNVSDKHLSDQKINVIVQESLARVGIDPEPYSAHSLRSGFATSAAEAGADIRMIMKQTRHARYETAEGYIQDGAGFDRNAMSLLSQL